MKTEEKLKHLEIIQGVINRLANNSFLIKGWTITISLAGFGLFANNNKPVFLVFVSFADVIFWFLDAYYLRQERLFRELYEDVARVRSRRKKTATKTLTMDTSRYHKRVSNISCVMLSFPTWLIYVAIIALAGVLYYGFN